MTDVVRNALQGGWEAAYQQQQDGTALWQEDPIPVIPAAVEALQERNARTVVDLGCGDGRNLAALVEAGLACLGVDIAPTGLAHARRGIVRRGFLMHGDATKLPLIDSSVDAVTCFDVFGQIRDPRALMAEAGRILGDGGLFVVNAFTLKTASTVKAKRSPRTRSPTSDTLFRFYREPELRALFDGWRIIALDRTSWVDPPHGEFRPHEHTHDNWVVFATPN